MNSLPILNILQPHVLLVDGNLQLVQLAHRQLVVLKNVLLYRVLKLVKLIYSHPQVLELLFLHLFYLDYVK